MAQLSTRLTWDLASTKWASELNPLLKNQLIQGVLLKDINLVASTPKAINHLLQRMPQGWFVTDKDSNANVWRSSAFNNLTLTLESDLDTTISLWVF